jgi:hypothetical protein
MTLFHLEMYPFTFIFGGTSKFLGVQRKWTAFFSFHMSSLCIQKSFYEEKQINSSSYSTGFPYIYITYFMVFCIH